MKKVTTLLLTLMLLACAMALTGCNNSEVFAAKTFSSAEQKIENVIIDVSDRAIEVSASSDNQIHIDYYSGKTEYYDITVSADNTLTMTLLKDKTWKDLVNVQPSETYRKIKMKIPSAFLANLTILTTNEEINLQPLMITNGVSLSSNGGNILFKQLNVGKTLSLTAKNGNINGTIVGSYDLFSIACEIKKGECNLPLNKEDGEKSLKASCNNGNIAIDFIKAA